jgi:hypothetical protein
MKAVTDLQTPEQLKKLGEFAKDVGVEPAYNDLTRKLDAIRDKNSVEGTYKIWGANTTFSWEANKAPVKEKRDAALKDPKNADIANFLEGLKKTVPDYKIMNNEDPTVARAQYRAQAPAATVAKPAAPIVTTVPSGGTKAPTQLHRTQTAPAAVQSTQAGDPLPQFEGFQNPDLPGVFNPKIMKSFLEAGRIIHQASGNSTFHTHPEMVEALVNTAKHNQRAKGPDGKMQWPTKIRGSSDVVAATNNAAGELAAYLESGYWHLVPLEIKKDLAELEPARKAVGAVPVGIDQYLSTQTPEKPPLPDSVGKRVAPPRPPVTRAP